MNPTGQLCNVAGVNTKVIIDTVGADESRTALQSARRAVRPLRLDQSQSLLERASGCIAGITQSMMKRPEQFAPGSFPVYLASGDGATVRDVDGNEYIDFISGLAANSLGHQHPAVLDAIERTVPFGLLHSLPAELEVRVAERLVRLLPNAQMVRFFKTGADATSAAARLARAATGRERLVTVGYNGWHDHFMYDTPGVPRALSELTTRMPLMRREDEEPLLSLVSQEGERLAAVILSIPYHRTLSAEFVRELRRLCAQRGAWFVLDEIVTGFRLALGGAQEYFGVQADLACFSKALAAGMPLSAVVGPKQRMQQMESLQVSTTFGGELLSLAVCEAALQVYEQTNYFEHIHELGRQLRGGVNRVAQDVGASLRVHGYDPIPTFLFDADPARHVPLMKRFVGLMAMRGVLLRRDVNFLCAAHEAAHVEHVITATRESLLEMAH